MKIYVYYQTTSKPFGGANQFLKLLKDEFADQNLLANSVSSADIILFNSHLVGRGGGEVFTKILNLKLQYPEKIFIHRIDGPVDLYRGTNLWVDSMIYIINSRIADGTIFQSKWSKAENLKMGYKSNSFEAVISNAADSNIFPKKSVMLNHSSQTPIKIAITSMSSNRNKGFDYYQYLDEKLDTNEFMVTFIGNSPVTFKNIQHFPPKTSIHLSKILQRSHIFLTASRFDPCSNSVIEALQLGLPVVALNSGGHPELVRQGGELFSDSNQLLPALRKVSKNLREYQRKIQIHSQRQIGLEYTSFLNNIISANRNKSYVPKALSLREKRLLTFKIATWNTKRKVKKELIKI